jgi:hypothetical protein
MISLARVGVLPLGGGDRGGDLRRDVLGGQPHRARIDPQFLQRAPRAGTGPDVAARRLGGAVLPGQVVLHPLNPRHLLVRVLRQVFQIADVGHVRSSRPVGKSG